MWISKFANNLRLAFYFYQQEKSATHNRYMRYTQILLMVFIVSLSQTSETIQQFLSDNMANLLGADVVLMQQNALNDRQISTLSSMSNKHILTQSLTTTLTHKDKWQRAKLKAVGQRYPLQGKVLTTSSLTNKAEVMKNGPTPGEIWLDSRLFSGLNMVIGDELVMAGHSFLVSRILVHEPDRLMESYSSSMRAMINLEDMRKLNFANDLITHRYMFEASAGQIKNILAWQKQQLPAAEVLHKTGSHPLALFWKRVENFLGLSSIILFFMAAIAIEKLTKVQVKRQQYFTAICMSLGAQKHTGLIISLSKWFVSVLTILPLVLLLSAASHWGLVIWLQQTFSEITWQFHWQATLKAVLSVALIFFIFQAPVWIGLMQSSIGQLIHNNQSKLSQGFTFICALLVLFLVAFAYSDNGMLTTMVLVAMAICILLIVTLSWVALTFGEKSTKQISGLFPFALFMMRQRMLNKSTQILGVGLCAFLLLFTLMLMRDLGSTISAYERQHNGNLLVSQASQEQMRYIQNWAQKHDVNIRQKKDFMYAKLTQVNGQLLEDYSDKPSESMATLARSIRLHWTAHVPANNKLVDGNWWLQNTSNWQQLSIEQEVMTDLGLTIGDTLTFYVGQRNVDFTISASHVYQPGAGSITFWVQMPESALSHVQSPKYSMASLELSDAQFGLLGDMWQKYPTLRMMSLQEMTERFDKTLAILTQAIAGFSILIILLSVIVILATVNALENEERKKNSVIMSFGFSRQTCLRLNLIEWLVTGFIAATGAIAGTYIAGLLIYKTQFSLHYEPDWFWFLGTLLAILSAVTLIGIAANRHSLKSSVRELLSE